jgi:hypothetical protein
MALDATASGVFPIAPAPLHPDGRLDEASIDTLINGCLRAGSSGITVLGIRGGTPKLEPEESIAIANQIHQGRRQAAGDRGRLCARLCRDAGAVPYGDGEGGGRRHDRACSQPAH